MNGRDPRDGAGPGGAETAGGAGSAEPTNSAETAAGDTRPADTDGGGPHRRVLALLLLVAALGGLGLATLGASAERAGEPVYVGEATQELPSFVQREEYQEPVWETASAQEQPPRPDGANTGVIATLIVLGVILAVLVAWVVYRMRKLARPAQTVAGEADEDELTVTQARAALDDARSHLSTVMEAHDAVIAAWLALERAIAAAGVRRRPSQTTLEFVVAVLATLQLDRSALDRLSHLYRRALFDDQPLVESDREEAIALLDRITAALDAGVDEGTR